MEYSNMYLSRIILLYILMEILTIRVQCNWHSVYVCVWVCVCVLGGYWSWLQDYSSNVSVPTLRTSKFLITKFLLNIYRLFIKIDTSWTTLCSSFHHSILKTLPQYGNGETRSSSSGDLLLTGQQCPSPVQLATSIGRHDHCQSRGGHGSWQSRWTW